MIEISSKWMIQLDENLKPFPAIIVYMTKNKEIYHCSTDASKWMDDGEFVLESLKSIFHNLINNLYPEINNPLIKYKKELSGLNVRIDYLKKIINDMEKKNGMDKY